MTLVADVLERDSEQTRAAHRQYARLLRSN